MPSAANTPRSAATLRAHRRYAMTCAWDQAYHVVSCYAPGAKNVATEARQLLAQGWVEAKLAEKHGHLIVTEVVAVAPAPAVRHVAFIKAEIEDLENRDRLGVPGLARLSALHVELNAAVRFAA